MRRRSYLIFIFHQGLGSLRLLTAIMHKRIKHIGISLSVKIYPVHSKDFDQYWPIARPFLAMSLEHTDGEYSIDNIGDFIKEKVMSLWMIEKDNTPIAAVTVIVNEYPTGLRVACVNHAGGKDFKSWDVFTDYISSFYYSIGCAKLEIAGRLGWQRLHTDKGFKPRYYVLRKDLNGQV